MTDYLKDSKGSGLWSAVAEHVVIDGLPHVFTTVFARADELFEAAS